MGSAFLSYLGALSSHLPQQTDAGPPISDTSQLLWCAICGDFLDFQNYRSQPQSWEDFVTSARSCVYCDAIVRGCRGWLDGSGRPDLTPSSLGLDPVSDTNMTTGELRNDYLVYNDGSEEDEVDASSAIYPTQSSIYMKFDFQETITLTAFAIEG
jgi:hypothetical protein